MRTILKAFNTHHFFYINGKSINGVISVVTLRGDLGHEQLNTASLSRGSAYSFTYRGSMYNRAIALHTSLRTALRTAPRTALRTALRTMALHEACYGAGGKRWIMVDAVT